MLGIIITPCMYVRYGAYYPKTSQQRFFLLHFFLSIKYLNNDEI